MKKSLFFAMLLSFTSLTTAVFADDVKPKEVELTAKKSPYYLRGHATINTPSGMKYVEFYSTTVDGGTLYGAGIDFGFWICEGSITVVDGIASVDAFIDSSSAGSFYYQGPIISN